MPLVKSPGHNKEPGAKKQTPASPDPVALGQLWADQFQHLATLAVSGAAGVLILIQVELLSLERRWWLVLGLFILSAVFSMYGQIAVVDQASDGKLPGRRPRLMRGLALACLGAAGGAAIGTLGLLQ